MRALGSLLSSAARTEILRTLAHQPEPIGLRQVARIAGVHPHSAERALAALAKEGLVTRRRSSTRALFALKRNNPCVPILEAVFAASERAFIQARNASLQERAQSLVPFAKQATRMLAHAKRQRDAT